MGSMSIDRSAFCIHSGEGSTFTSSMTAPIYFEQSSECVISIEKSAILFFTDGKSI